MVLVSIFLGREEGKMNKDMLGNVLVVVLMVGIGLPIFLYLAGCLWVGLWVELKELVGGKRDR